MLDESNTAEPCMKESVHIPHVDKVNTRYLETLVGYNARRASLAVRELGAERVLYGSDAGGRSFASQLAKVFGADIPESAKRLLLGENLKRLLRPILREKGIKV